MDNSLKTPIPAGISEYIKNHFRDDYLTDIRTVTGNSGDTSYFVDVTHDKSLFHLKFDSQGKLVLQETEPILDLDDDEEIGGVD